MATDKSDNGRSFHLSGFIALAALLIAAAGGYLYYQDSRSPEVTAGSEQSAAPPQAPQSAPASGASAPSQQAASDAGAPAGQSSNAGSQPAAQTPAPLTDSAAAVPPGQNQVQGQAQDQAQNPTVSGSPAAPAGSTAQNEQSKSASLPTNEVAYVQKSRANIRSEPSVRGKRVGQLSKGTKLNVVARAGKWVQVEGGNTKGWINANLLAPSP